MKRALVLFFLLISVFALNAGAQSDGAVSDNQIPEGSILKKKIEELPPAEKSFLIVKSQTIDFPESWSGLSEPERQLELFNTASRISTQKGITYISRRAGYKPKILFEQSYYIDSPEESGRKILEDPVSVTLPPSLQRFAEQKDSTFGSNIYVHDITNAGNETVIEISNYTPMKYHGITCLKKDELRMYMSVMQQDGKIVLTSAVRVCNHERNIRILFLNVDIADSFTRRIDAVALWFRNLIEKENPES